MLNYDVFYKDHTYHPANTKIKYMIYISLLLLLPLLVPSKKNNVSLNHETINEVVYTSFDGGKGGSYFNLKVTKAYASLEIGSVNSRKVYGEPTDPVLWKQLSKTSLREFDKIVSGKRTAEADGTDEEVQITTDVKKHAFLNGRFGHSKKISKLIAALQKEMTDIAKPANQKYPE